QPLALRVIHHDVRCVWKSRRSFSIDVNEFNPRLGRSFEPVAKSAHPVHILFQPFTREPCRLAESDNSRDILRPQSPVSLVAATGHDRFNGRTFLNEKRADALWPMNLVGRNGK